MGASFLRDSYCRTISKTNFLFCVIEEAHSLILSSRLKLELKHLNMTPTLTTPLTAQFTNIEVHPYYQLFDPLISDISGGPVWPNFNQRSFERHMKCKTIDHEFDIYSKTNARLSGRFVWLGPIVDHFGHQLIEFSTRIAMTASLNPNAQYLAAIQVPISDPRAISPTNNWHYPTITDIPPYLRGILDWLGAPEQRITLVTTPVVVDELEVFEQGEQMLISPKDWYLDALDKRVPEQQVRGNRVYVSRTQLKSPFGQTLGEQVIENAFAKDGFQILHPESVPINVQARIYADARTIVVSEGSAIHGLGLLGHISANVIVIECRNNLFQAEVFARSIAPRVDRFIQIQAIEECIPDHGNWRAISLLDPGVLVSELLEEQIDLRTHLKQSDYWASATQDLNIISHAIDTSNLPQNWLAGGAGLFEYESLTRLREKLQRRVQNHYHLE